MERTWTFQSSGVHFHGTFASVKEGKVQIQRGDGKILSVSLEHLIESDRDWVAARNDAIRRLNETRDKILLVNAPMPMIGPPKIEESFEPFSEKKYISYRQDDRYFYVESDGMPDHRMMVGITAWQQQVPMPQSYFGGNAWRIPLHPVVAKKPLSAKSHFFRGAIAIAANGIPIFNPIKNDGRTDTLIAGELDEFGGHCGRADDYHYHIAPLHLQDVLGTEIPIAYALDGYPIYGLKEPDGSAVQGLDAFNGHDSKELGYHYHATKGYPYLNGGFHGEVIEKEGQVDPQPQAHPVRPSLPPMRGAKIVEFVETKQDEFELTYEVDRKKGSVRYSINQDGSSQFKFQEPNGRPRTENYPANRRAGGGGGGGRNERSKQPAQKANSLVPSQTERMDSKDSSSKTFAISSPAFEAGGMLPMEYTCDGEKASPPLEWKGAPEGTKALAFMLWHTAPDQTKCYWLVYNIPVDVHSIEKNDTKTGTVGLNDKKKGGYDPMCSKGPGLKKYHVTMYALAKELDLPAGKVNRATFLKAIEGNTLGEATLDFQYERKK